MSFDSLPFTLGWELTLACNLRCKHCGSSAGRARSNELTTEEALRLCDQFPALLVQEVDFTGGEPLLRRDWPQIAGRLKELGITTGVVTNGVNLDQETVSNLVEAGISHVAVSVDGLEESHDFMRGEAGLWRKSMNGVRHLLEAKVHTTIITTVTDRNIDDLPELFDLLVHLGIPRWRPQPVILSGRVGDFRSLPLRSETYLRLIEFFQTWGPKGREHGLELLRADGLGYFFPCDTSRGEWNGCPAGLVSAGITSDGKVKGCLSLGDDFIEGDLREESLWDIWFGDDAFAYTRGFGPSRLGENCRECVLAEQCRGGCTAMSVGYTGKCNNDPLCYEGIAKRQETLATM